MLIARRVAAISAILATAALLYAIAWILFAAF